MVDLPITKWIKKKIRRLIGIVEDTDVATHSIASEKYVVWKGDLHKSTAAIAVGGSLSLSNLSPVSDGGINELSEQIGTVDSKLKTKSFSCSTVSNVVIVGSQNCYAKNGIAFVNLNGIKYTASDPSGWVTMVRLPSSITCEAETYSVIEVDTGTNVMKAMIAKILQNGNLQFYAPTQNTLYFGGIIFPCTINS